MIHDIKNLDSTDLLQSEAFLYDMDDKYHSFNQHHFWNACSDGNLNLAKFLFQGGTVTECVSGRNHWETYCYRCQSSEDAQKYNIDISDDIDISGDKERAFRSACVHGHSHVAKWLLDIKPDIIDTPYVGNYVFQMACENASDEDTSEHDKLKHVELAKWIFSIKPDINVSVYCDINFRSVCLSGNLEFAKWLFKIKPDVDISYNNHETFRDLCEEGHFEVAKWLVSIRPWLYQILPDNSSFILPNNPPFILPDNSPARPPARPARHQRNNGGFLFEEKRHQRNNGHVFEEKRHQRNNGHVFEENMITCLYIYYYLHE